MTQTIAAFFVHGNLKRGESVLIHSGAGGVGQAAINIATYYECEIFTTVGTAEKREFIKKNFPHVSIIIYHTLQLLFGRFER